MFTRILLAVDGTDNSDTAADFTVALARKSSGVVRVVYVNQFVVGGRGYAVHTEPEAMAIVDQAVARLRGAGIEADGVHFLANCFAVDSTIADSAHRWGADLIVFGSRRRRLLRRFGGQGIRERVTSRTGLPTLTAPPPLRVAGRFHKGHASEPVRDLEVPTFPR